MNTEEFKSFELVWGEVYNGIETILYKADTDDFSNIPLTDFIYFNG